jgi:oligopeptide transport system ATP-binding protein
MYAGGICEQGTADEIFYNPKHEYTKGLMRSIPTAENNGQRLQPITGTPIDLLNMPAGCPFAPRCEKAMKVCLQQRPERLFINKEHFATCWLNVKDAINACIPEPGTPQAEDEKYADALMVLASALATNQRVLKPVVPDTEEGGYPDV